jgi:nucleoside-diphosphate-sugar epimerase
MRTLVTGATGFIGGHLVDRLLKDNHQVRCLVRHSSNRRWLAGKPLELVECEKFDDNSAVRSLVRDIDVVFHVLGTLVAPTLDAFRKVNVQPVKTFLDACQEEKGLKRFILVGSHGAAGPTLKPEGGLIETDPCHPVSAYGRSKLEAEEVTRQYRGKVPYTILRLSAVYGPRDVNFLRIFKSAVRKGKIPQVGRELKAICLAHVSDIVEGIYRASITEPALNETYFLASERSYSFQDIAAVMTTILKREIKVRVIPNLVIQGMMLYADVLSKVFGKDILLNRDRLTTLACRRWVCDVSKARADLQYRQTVSLEEGFRETWEWYRQEGLL